MSTDNKEEETLHSWYRQLDSIRSMMENAQEEYGQYLEEFEAQCGTKEREKYEEEHL